MNWLNPFSFYQEKATGIQVYPCPACHETISARAAACRFCNNAVDPATAQRLLAENQRVTSAVASANTFKLSVWLAIVQMLLGLWDALTRGAPEGVSSLAVIALGYGVLWLYRYRSLITRDADYPIGVKRVKRTIMVWFLALLLPWAIYAIEVWTA